MILCGDQQGDLVVTNKKIREEKGDKIEWALYLKRRQEEILGNEWSNFMKQWFQNLSSNGNCQICVNHLTVGESWWFMGWDRCVCHSHPYNIEKTINRMLHVFFWWWFNWSLWNSQMMVLKASLTISKFLCWVITSHGIKKRRLCHHALW